MAGVEYSRNRLSPKYPIPAATPAQTLGSVSPTPGRQHRSRFGKHRSAVRFLYSEGWERS